MSIHSTVIHPTAINSTAINSTAIHPTAIIDKSSFLDSSVTVGPYCVIGPNVNIGAGTKIYSQVCIEKDTTIGENCRVFPFASVGADPQDLKYNGEKTNLIIGDNVNIRESVTIHRGTALGGGTTKIANKVLVMADVHIAHDCQIGEGVILSSYVVLAGHVEVQRYASIGGLSAVHQFCRIGEHAFIGGTSGISRDVPPFMLVAGSRNLEVSGPNIIGLKRLGTKQEVLDAISDTFKIICRNRRPINEVLKETEEKYPNIEEVKKIIEFYRSSERGVYR